MPPAYSAASTCSDPTGLCNPSFCSGLSLSRPCQLLAFEGVAKPLIASGYSDVSSLDYFTTPPPVGPISDYSNNPNYTIGQQVNLEWQTNITVGVSLWIYQVADAWAYAPIFKGQHSVPTTYEWTVSNLDLGLTNGTVFYFHLTNSTDTGDDDPIPGCFSHFFNILEADPSSAPGDSSSASTSALPTTTSNPATSSSVPSSHTAATSTNTTSQSASPSNAAPVQQGNSLSSGAKAGIGVGAGLVATALIVGALIWFMRRKRSASRQVQSSPPYTQQADRYHDNGVASGQDGLPQYEKRRPLAGVNVGQATHEMPVNGQRHELGGPDVHELGGTNN
ncbi:hypothetical protein LTR49_024388 [Elasticomyces elasticus]|nr:hypothetical protein LTR49_024388 [Elasticomyces elasticus]KAK5745076.1 hypothetical protein LTS12_023230 [Elasticomyces elasticus]